MTTPPQFYTIRFGDTLDAIAAKYDTTVDDILTANPHIEKPDFLPMGRPILIPDKPVVFEPSDDGGLPKIAKVNEVPEQIPSTPQSPELSKAEPNQKIKNTHPDLVKSEESIPNNIKEDCMPCKKKCRVRIGCQHNSRVYDKMPKTYSVVPDTKKENALQYHFDVVHVWLEGDNAPDVIYLDGIPQKKQSAGYGGKHFKIEVPYADDLKTEDQITLKGLSEKFTRPIKEFKLTGACLGEVIIKVHCPDVWEMTIGFPAWESLDMGRRRYGGARASTAREEVIHVNEREGSTTHSINQHRNLTTGEVLAHEAEPGVSYPVGVALKCNNKQLKLDDVMAFYKVFEAGKNISELFQAVLAHCKPKWGVYFTLTYGFMEGGFLVKWHEKEYLPDHRAYTYFEFSFSVKIITIALEIGIGVWVTNDVGAQIFFKVTGEIGGSSKVLCDAPSETLGAVKKDIILIGKLEFDLGVRAEAGDNVKFEAILNSGFELPATVSIAPTGDPWFSVKGDLKWKGITGKMKIMLSSGKGGGSFEYDWEQNFVKPYQVFDFYFPGKEQKYIPPFVEEHKIRKIFEDALTDGFNIEVSKVQIKKGGWYGIFDKEIVTDMKMENIIDALVDPIIKNPYMKPDEETIKLLAMKVNEDLEVMGERDWEWDYVAKKDFDKYVRGKYLDILVNYEDQALKNSDRVAGRYPRAGYIERKK
ncbi:LysM peptidoglycan-binding domain-containing protein [Endozoicomonas sp. SM1973]|uniref:LysM peptidoglycan-binding domain-containing protein n=1 Tax=Spartinivicinus marinus TaxID=2994442 RepID=A0A853I2X7_9GAMM|nr:LysM domain-containing protein [Spartinivicinus marinus]MCX4029240.1 LysM domain-containing protein [Spartinivicinus marinus]NYZ65852.1 LysM peptidoglycan-binding domain-containing protein [Spartinivicinus marinus]